MRLRVLLGTPSSITFRSGAKLGGRSREHSQLVSRVFKTSEYEKLVRTETLKGTCNTRSRFEPEVLLRGRHRAMSHEQDTHTALRPRRATYEYGRSAACVVSHSEYTHLAPAPRLMSCIVATFARSNDWMNASVSSPAASPDFSFGLPWLSSASSSSATCGEG